MIYGTRSLNKTSQIAEITSNATFKDPAVKVIHPNISYTKCGCFTKTVMFVNYLYCSELLTDFYTNKKHKQ